MSTTTTTQAESSVKQPKRASRGPVILHYVSTAAIEMGVEDKALCGRWLNPSKAESPTSHRGQPARVCKPCQQAYEKMPDR